MIGLYVKENRLKLGITQGELADMTQVSKSYISLVELNKRKIGKNKIEDFAKVLQVSIEEIKENNRIKEITTELYIRKVDKTKRELDLLIESTKKALIYLEKSRQALDEVDDFEDIDDEEETEEEE